MNHAKKVSEKQLKALADDMERQRIESEEFRRREDEKKLNRQRQGCAQCRNEYNTWFADWRRGATKHQCSNEHRSCTFSRAGLPGPNSGPRSCWGSFWQYSEPRYDVHEYAKSVTIPRAQCNPRWDAVPSRRHWAKDT